MLVIIIGIVICAATIIINTGLRQRIEYYESSQGIFVRAINDSAEKEYRELIGERNAMLMMGLSGFITSIGGYGIYREMISKDYMETMKNSDS
ncbi:hypothetical protein Shell_1524 [Staphylothermus hellenicus DSM 12710]|uniref:Uncharacterized protein n=1 Tax=Staphylothermus hellenicus (strain DSM 12710 / JCM 10830 / BK20S6-10-b1 / P8) TaxID=591019 RepID=D7DA16_STAHD|nr:hypothetical protein Shell_1524 [Staphylothermus hellenicus DSM 12710]